MALKSLSGKIMDFITTFEWPLRGPGRLPEGVKLLQPWKDQAALEVCSAFYKRYYSDQNTRVLVLGINPGRFGGGQTGIPFTDPVRLETDCGISNPFQKRPELSSEFIYHMIAAYGGAERFYSRFLISSVCPVGFTRDGKNLNYYDLPILQKKVEEYVPEWMERQLGFGIERKVSYCLGEGKNFDFLNRLNARHQWFDQIIPLAHPRFIMQYRRKKMESYVNGYLFELEKS
jgi:hypothetical protein